jgi:hypothetical protein
VPSEERQQECQDQETVRSSMQYKHNQRSQFQNSDERVSRPDLQSKRADSKEPDQLLDQHHRVQTDRVFFYLYA